MRIQIITERELRDEDYWGWAEASMENINKLKRQDKAMGAPNVKFLTKDDFQILLDNGQLVLEDDYGFTKAKTIYRVIK